MWTIKHLEAYNFMNFDSMAFDFDQKCYVIRGVNLDNDGQESNGSGKSSFIDALTVALLGYTLSGRSVKDLVRWDSDQSYFETVLKLENKEYNLHAEIKRKHYNNTRSGELVLLVNGEVPKTIPTKKGVENGTDLKEGNKYILNELLDINEEDLLNYFLISKKHYQPFLQVNTDRKLEVISRFTNTKVVDKVIIKLESEERELESQSEDMQLAIAEANGYVQALSSSMSDEAVSAWEEKKEEKLASTIETIDKIELDIKETEQRITAQELLIEDITFHIIEEATRKNLQEKLSSLNTKEEKELKNDLRFQANDAERYLAGLITCPKCEHQFDISGTLPYTADDLVSINTGLEEVDVVIAEVESEIKEIKLQIEEIDKLDRENKNKERERRSIETTINSIKKQKERLEAELEKKMLELDTEAAVTFEDEKADITQQIEEKKVEIEVLNESLKQAQEKRQLNLDWIGHFSDFKFYLGNKPLALITSLINQYLELNGSDLNLKIEGFKKLKNGEIRQSLNPVIFRNWMNPRDYNSFSAGEQCRLDTCTSLAFQQLINASSKHGGLNLFVSDETLNNLDSLGIKNAAESFNILDKTILLVSHSGSDVNYKNTIVIEKKNGASTIHA
jgi:DNA repair exonuclease SbcCD ATPase subunit